MEEWIESVKEALGLLSKAEKELIKNCVLLTWDTATLVSAFRNGTAVDDRDVIGASNHVKSFFNLVRTIKDQREKHIGDLARKVLNGTGIIFNGEEVRQYYIDNDMIDAYREVMTGQM